MKDKKSKYYYEQGRNTSSTECSFNPKMLLSKGELDYSKDKIPNYYIGKVYGYEARKVIEDFDLSYKMDKVETANIRGQRDKVETRTGGLAHDRINERQ